MSRVLVEVKEETAPNGEGGLFTLHWHETDGTKTVELFPWFTIEDRAWAIEEIKQRKRPN